MMSQPELTHAAATALREAAQAIEETDEYTAQYKIKAGTAYNKALDLYCRGEFYEKQAHETNDANRSNAADAFKAAASSYAVAGYFWDFITKDFSHETAQDQALESAPKYEAEAQAEEYAGEKALIQKELDNNASWAHTSQADDEEEQAEAKSQQANAKRRQADRIEKGNPEGAQQLRTESKELLRQVRRHRREAGHHRGAAVRAKITEAKAKKAQAKAEKQSS